MSLPGAGKTILGLELIRQFDVPAVVFVPTMTIQPQWYEKVGMFLDPSGQVGKFACMDPVVPIEELGTQCRDVPAGLSSGA